MIYDNCCFRQLDADLSAAMKAADNMFDFARLPFVLEVARFKQNVVNHSESLFLQSINVK